jgi:hypothetical protein
VDLKTSRQEALVMKNAPYIISTSDKEIAQVRAHKTGTTSDENTRGFNSRLRFDESRLVILFLQLCRSW